MAESSSHPDAATPDPILELEDDEITEETREVDPDGDLYLEIEDLKLLVSSKVLSLASPVFSTMFKSRFKESLANHQGPEKPTVTLREDDATTMELICWVLHHRADKVPEMLGEGMLVEVAEHCDKYDCAAALKGWVTTWIWGPYHDLDVDNQECSHVLFAAYVFDKAEAFSFMSLSVIMQQVGPFEWLPILPGHELLDASLPGNQTSPST